jgi:uncharacterized membrane protein YdjX (TVP38/TMEM64 family)
LNADTTSFSSGGVSGNMNGLEKNMSGGKALFKAALLLSLICLIFVLHRVTDVSSHLTSEKIGHTIQAVRVWMNGFGVLGPAIFIVSGVLLTLINTPAVFVIYAGVVLYGTFGGLAVSALSTHAAANVIFLIGRWLGRDFVSYIFRKRIAVLESYSRDQGLMMVMYLRVFFFLAPGISWVLSVTGVSHRDYLLGTFLGTVPQFLIQIWIGSKIVSLVESGQSLNPMKTPELLLPFAAAVVFLAGAHGLKKAREGKA